LLSIDELKALLSTIKSNYDLDKNAEITLEANPGTVSIAYLRKLLDIGINRLCLGFQSMNDRELMLLGRIHDAKSNLQTFVDARKAGFSNVSCDLIYGLPGQKLCDFESTLRLVIKMEPEHISLYALTLHESAPLARRISRGEISEIDDDVAADMYEWASLALDKADYTQYEISNWCRNAETRDFRSVHNLQYWHNQPYLGFGAGAHSFSIISGLKIYTRSNHISID